MTAPDLALTGRLNRAPRFRRQHRQTATNRDTFRKSAPSSPCRARFSPLDIAPEDRPADQIGRSLVAGHMVTDPGLVAGGPEPHTAGVTAPATTKGAR